MDTAVKRTPTTPENILQELFVTPANDKGLSGVLVPINTDPIKDQMTAELRVMVGDCNKLSKVKQILAVQVAADIQSAYYLSVTIYYSCEDKLVTYDHAFTLDVLPVLIGCVGERNIEIQWFPPIRREELDF